MLILVHWFKLWVYNVILRATTKKAILRDTLKSTGDKSKWNSKTHSSNPRESRTKETGKQKTERTNRKQKIKVADLALT